MCGEKSHYALVYFSTPGLICAEGIRWREHRRFSLSVLKNMGMVKIGGNREAMGERIFQSAHDLIQV
jgi:aromatic ring-cleaving dioxygenase